MALIEPRHCGKPDPHEPHRGQMTDHLGPWLPVRCQGDPAGLASQEWIEANPPPGPQALRRYYRWDS